MGKESRLAVKKAEYEGNIFKSNRYGDVIVLEYLNGKQVIIKFLDTGYVTTEQMGNIKTGKIKDATMPTEVGVGYIGAGRVKDRNLVTEYNLWRGMLARCYDEKQYDKLYSYQDCTVSENFKHLSIFSEWCNKQIGFNRQGFQLDKDIVLKGNKIYSEDTCCFVPKEINLAMVTSSERRGTMPQGVSWNCTKTRYRARIQRGNEWTSLGTYDTPEEAFYKYKPVKEAHVKNLADKYKDQIDPRVYEALMNWEINIDD